MKNRVGLLFFIFLIFNVFSLNYLFSKELFDIINPKRFTNEEIQLLGSHEKFTLPKGMLGQMQNKLRQSADRVLKFGTVKDGVSIN